jgi:hypothetical protein
MAAKKSKQWTITTSKKDIPPALREKDITRFFVEFLDIDQQNQKSTIYLNEDGLRTNNCVVRLVFKIPQDADTGHAPPGTTSIILDLQYEPIYSRTAEPGQLNIRTADYPGNHRFAVKAIEIPIRYGKSTRKFKHFLEVTDKNSLIPCHFSTAKSSGVVGCKYFMRVFQSFHTLRSDTYS